VRMEDTFFVSYSRRDRNLVLRLVGDLRAAGSQIWVDLDIRPGDHWDRAVETALRDCVGMLLILSPSSVASENVLDEVTIALEAGKPVIPVRIEPCNLPLRLARVQFIDATSDYAEALKRCSAAMITGARKAISLIPSAARELPALSPEVTAKVCALLTRFMGPISKNLVWEESQRVASLQELSLRLAALIPEEKERALFIASVRAI